MTKKDYELIAKVIRENEGDDMRSHIALVNALAYALEQANPRFDRPRFLAACDIICQTVQCKAVAVSKKRLAGHYGACEHGLKVTSED